MDTNWYFGIPGQLFPLLSEYGSEPITTTRVRPQATFQLGSGAVRVSTLLAGARTFTLPYRGLTLATFNQLQAFCQGLMGPGPFALLDPGQRNMLPPNQSSATALTNDTTGFSVTGTGGTISSDGTVAGATPRSLRWTFATSTPGTSVLTLKSPVSSWPLGIPCVDRPITFWLWAKTNGSVTLQLRLNRQRLGADGTVLSTSSTSFVTLNATSWTQLSLTDTTIPAPSAYLAYTVEANSATIAAGNAVYLNGFMLNEGLAPDQLWSAGTGVRPVAIVGLAEQQMWRNPQLRRATSLVLQEVI